MSVSTNVNERPTIAHQLVWWWRNWMDRRAAVSELQCCSPTEAERVAHDVGVSSSDLCVLAGKWPGSAEYLTRRLEQLELKAADIAQAEPQVIGLHAVYS